MTCALFSLLQTLSGAVYRGYERQAAVSQRKGETGTTVSGRGMGCGPLVERYYV